MNAENYLKDLIIVVADSEMDFVMHSLLEQRHQSLGIRQIAFDIKRHIHRDAGCLTDCHNYLREDLRYYHYSMVIFDKEGCGREQYSRTEIELEVEDRLSINGWSDRCAAIVIDPELEAWVWSDSSEVDMIFGWKDRTPPLREWIKSKTPYWPVENLKPERPKEALQSAMKAVRQPFSSRLFSDLAQAVSLQRCIDPSFLKFKNILTKWFPI